MSGHWERTPCGGAKWVEDEEVEEESIDVTEVWPVEEPAVAPNEWTKVPA